MGSVAESFAAEGQRIAGRYRIEALIAQGHIGVQVWINQGTYSEDETDGADAKTGQAPKKPKRAYKR